MPGEMRLHRVHGVCLAVSWRTNGVFLRRAAMLRCRVVSDSAEQG